MGLFGSKKPNTISIKRKLTLDYHGVLKDMKKSRVDQCQRNGASLSQMGMDLAHLERKAREFYNLAVKLIKDGESHEDVYNHLVVEVASSDVDRLIIEKLFSAK